MERNIVVLVQDFAIEYAQEALDGIYDYLKDKDVNLIISQIRLPDFSTGYYEYQYFASTQILKAKEIDVVIVLSGGFCSTIPSEKLAEYLEPLKSKKIISMAIPLPLEGSYHTYSGCEDVYTEIIGHLAKEHGCKKIAFAAANPDVSVEGKIRFEAYKKGLLNNGLEYSSDLVYDCMYMTYDHARDYLLDNFDSKEKINFDAILASNDMMAFGCIAAVEELGLKVPEDIKVFGYDNIAQSQRNNLSLSTIDQQIYAQGRTCAELAYKVINDENISKSTKTHVLACYRESCGCKYESKQSVQNEIASNKPQTVEEYIEGIKFTSNLYYSMDLLQRADVLTELFDKFEMILKSTKFLAAAVCLYDTPIILKKANNFYLPNRVKLGVAIDLETGERQINKNISFNPNDQMLPENIFQNKKGQYVMQPIFYGENQYGYIICRIETKMYVHNSIFLKLVSNAISQAYEFTEKVEESKRLSKENKILQNRYKNLNEQSKLDELANVLNRRGFMEAGQKAIDFALEMDLVGLVVFGDMNGLKTINDTYGHEMGDSAIQHQAEVLKKAFRSNDVIGRLSGDEFAIVITSAKLDSLDSIREKVNKIAVSVCYQSDLPFSISISLGAVEFNKENYELKELLKRADEQQYIEKRRFHKERR